MKVGFGLAGILLLAAVGLGPLGAGLGGSFDKLSDADRKAFQERFEREVWPLLLRGGKDGCVGCHDLKGRNAPHFSGDAAKDFRALLKEGFFLHDDPGNLVTRVATKDKKRRMPPGNRPPWPDADVQVLRQFIADVDKKQQK